MRHFLFTISLLLSVSAYSQSVNFPLIKITDAWTNEANSDLNKLTEQEFETFAIGNIEFYGEGLTYTYAQETGLDCYFDKTIYKGKLGEIRIFQVLSGGEAMKYLITYDAKGNFADYIIVVYSDAVEYLTASEVEILGNIITRFDISYGFDEDEEPQTTTVRFQITKDLKFQELENQ